MLRGKEPPQWLVAIGTAMLIKYGIWTVIVLGAYWSIFYASSPFIYSINLPLHAGMVAEGILLAGFVRKKSLNLILPLSFLLANDFLDYSIGIHAYVPVAEWWLPLEAFSSTIIISALMFLSAKNKK